jgi:hypothetical protein
MNMSRKITQTGSKFLAKGESSPCKNNQEILTGSKIMLEYSLVINNTAKNEAHRIVISEPLDILPKSMQINEESVKTGAPISFVTIERLTGNSMGVEKLGKSNGDASKISE